MMKKNEILLVDDDTITLEGVCANLELEGYEITNADSGELAIRILNKKSFDLVITDLVMHPIDGMEVLKKAKKLHPDTMVIIFTAHADLSSAIDALRFDADDYLTKPYDVDELYFRVARCFEKLEHRRKMKATEDALLESEKNFRALAENANDAILIAGNSGAYVYANKRANEVTGYTFSELTRLSIRELISPDEFAKINTHYKKTLAGKNARVSYETNIIQKHGDIVPVEVTDAKTVWQGNPAVMWIFRDITERRRLYEDLRIKDSAIESAMNAIAFCDPDQLMVYVNRSFLELWGYDSIEDVKGRPAGSFWKEPDIFSEKISALWEDGSWIGESVARRKDGSEFCAQISASMVTDKQGNPVLTMESFIDISEKKQMEEALRKSNEDLKTRVQERTVKLMNINKKLKHNERQLSAHKTELEKVNEELRDSNQALSALARNIEIRKKDAEKRVGKIVSSKILPLLETLKKDKSIASRRADFDLLEAYLHDLTLDETGMPNPILTFSLTEVQLATMIKNGFSTKEIASQLGVSLSTVKTHRKNIRRKLNIQKSDVNLAAYLRSKMD